MVSIPANPSLRAGFEFILQLDDTNSHHEEINVHLLIFLHSEGETILAHQDFVAAEYLSHHRRKNTRPLKQQDSITARAYKTIHRSNNPPL
jgi:hypothetical protein